VGTISDTEFDVIVIGYGAAGAMSAIAAHDAGARVLVLEKMPDPGGLTIVSAGGMRCAFDRDAALSYLRATCGGRTPDDEIVVLADGMVTIGDEMKALAAAVGAHVKVTPAVGNYPLPGFEALGYCEVTDVPGLADTPSFHRERGLRPGFKLFKMLDDNVRARGIAVRLGAAAERLIWKQEEGVRGVRASVDGKCVDVIARRGVILACGGFESSEELKRSYLQAMPVLAGAVSGNTGDGILMAQAVGAKLRHMWHYHGPYGLRHTSPDYPFGIYLKAVPMWTPSVQDVSDLGVVDGAGKPLPTKTLPKLPWIVCDSNGQRFMDEYPPYPGDFGVRPLDQFDSKTQSFPRIPAFMIFDEVGRRMYPLGRCVSNDRNIWYEWSKDNEKEVALGILERADSIAALAERAGIPVKALEQTVADWNSACAARRDEAFGRRPETMVPIAQPPFYFGRVWPVVTNTQGGPAPNARTQVLDPFDAPIPRLYSAGELGSLFGHLYMSGGNLTECIVNGRIAGREAAALSPWQ